MNRMNPSAMKSKAQKSDRIFVDVKWSGGLWRAVCRGNGHTMNTGRNKAYVVDFVKDCLLDIWAWAGIPGERVLHTKSGKIVKGKGGRATYGLDPKGRG